MRLKFTLLLFGLLAVLSGCSTGRVQARDLCNEALARYWGEWDVVVDIATEAIELDPTYAWPYSQRGAAYNELAMYGEAIKDLKKAASLDPGFGPAYTNLSIALIRSGQGDKARPYLEKAYELTPNDPILLITMAEFMAVTGEFIEACEWFRKGLDKGYNDWNHIETAEYLNDFRNASCYNLIAHDATKPPLIFESQ